MPTDKQRLDWLEANSDHEISKGWDDELPWVVHQVSGGPNDREWFERGRGDTAREAIDAAHAQSTKKA
jgi:hypothetical protein